VIAFVFDIRVRKDEVDSDPGERVIAGKRRETFVYLLERSGEHGGSKCSSGYILSNASCRHWIPLAGNEAASQHDVLGKQFHRQSECTGS